MSTEVEVICAACTQPFSVPSSVLASRALDVCVACFRTSAGRLHLTGPPPIFKPDLIDLNLYLGGYRCATELKSLEEHNITHVLVCGSSLKQNFPDKIQYMQYFVEDEIDQDLTVHFQSAYDFIEKATDGNVLVHCHAGVSRSATILISYLMKKKGMHVDDVIALVKAKRPCVNPNPGFLQQLRRYDIELFGPGDESTGLITAGPSA